MKVFCPAISPGEKHWACSLSDGHSGDHKAYECDDQFNRLLEQWPSDTSASLGYREIGFEIGKLVDEKQAAYGKAFQASGEFLALLYPDGLKPAQYRDALALVRVFDKMKRIATGNDPMGEDPWRDIAGYALLSIEANARS